MGKKDDEKGGRLWEKSIVDGQIASLANDMARLHLSYFQLSAIEQSRYARLHLLEDYIGMRQMVDAAENIPDDGEVFRGHGLQPIDDLIAFRF